MIRNGISWIQLCFYKNKHRYRPFLLTWCWAVDTSCELGHRIEGRTYSSPGRQRCMFYKLYREKRHRQMLQIESSRYTTELHSYNMAAPTAHTQCQQKHQCCFTCITLLMSTQKWTSHEPGFWKMDIKAGGHSICTLGLTETLCMHVMWCFHVRNLQECRHSTMVVASIK